MNHSEIEILKRLEDLRAANQSHLAEQLDLLWEDVKTQGGSAEAQNRFNRLYQELAQVDLALINRLYQELVVAGEQNQARELRPMPADRVHSGNVETFRQAGLRALSRGEVAVLLLAGGQGSRLGHEGPKGTFDIGLASHKSLFEIQADSLKELAEAAHFAPAWYIMTSATNHCETVAFFEAHNYFDYPKHKVHFFQQGMMPSVDFNNRILLVDADQVALNPDGNGGCFIAMKRHGILDQLQAEGVKWLFLYGVDNAIVNIADPVFVGYTLLSGKPAASKVVAKAHPGEKVGVLCYDHGRPAIVEYSEMTPEDTCLLDANGNLVFGNGSILNHLLSVEVLREYMDQPLTFHLATKKIPYWEAGKGLCQPTEPNGYKYESFLFDLFPHFSDMGALLVDRHMEFAPVKNASGEDSPETARKLYCQKHGLNQ